MLLILLLLFQGIIGETVKFTSGGTVNCSVTRWGEYRVFQMEKVDNQIYVTAFDYNYWCDVNGDILTSVKGGNVTICDNFLMEKDRVFCNYTSAYVSPLIENPDLIILGYRNVCFWDMEKGDWNCDSVRANRATVECTKNITTWNCNIKYYIKDNFIRFYNGYENMYLTYSSPFYTPSDISSSLSMTPPSSSSASFLYSSFLSSLLLLLLFYGINF